MSPLHRVSGAIPSPNIWEHPDTYETLNRAADPDGLVDAALARFAPWAGGTVVDVGCGTGFHLPMYAASAEQVIGIEPHAALVRLARERAADLPQVLVQQGSAAALPLPDRSVDAVHARWAYFFGPGCEPGLAEAFRVLRPGGVLAVVDVDPRGQGYAQWFRAAWPQYDPETVESFWDSLGFTSERLAVRWRFGSRDDLKAVLAIEFPKAVAKAAAAGTKGREIAVPTVLRYRLAGLLS